jgi:uncharacterized protein YbjT (DUF2867 family)
LLHEADSITGQACNLFVVKVVIFGATGMVGKGVLLECLDDSRVEQILLISRHPIDVSHPKIRECLHQNFFDFASIQAEFAGFDACFFCLGVSSVGISESEYHHLTYDLTLAAANALAAATAGRLTFCYVSGEGTDSTEHGRTAWARIKGKTENALLRLPFKAAYMFRPGYIQPLRSIKSKTRWYQAVYDVLGPLYPVFRRVFPRYVTTTVNMGRAMIEVAATGTTKQILTSADINRLAGAA